MFGDYEAKAVFSRSVYLAFYKPSNKYVALKRISADNTTDEEMSRVCHEISYLRELNHPNILTIESVFVKNFDINIIFPFYCFGSCSEAIKNFFFTGFPEIIAALILRDMLTALDYLHKRGIVHRSIRASKVLLNQTSAVLMGFRDATSLMLNGKRIKCLHSLPQSKKSVNWYAPEILEQNLIGYSEKSDIYSVGITCCELANGIAPFADLPSTLMLTEKIRGNQPSLLDCSTFPTDEIIAQAMESGIGIGEAWAADQTRQIYSSRSLSDHFHKFAEQCMARFPDNRPTAQYLLTQHQFFKQCRHTSLEEQLKIFLEPVDFDRIDTDNLAQKPDIDELSKGINEKMNINDTIEKNRILIPKYLNILTSAPQLMKEMIEILDFFIVYFGGKSSLCRIIENCFVISRNKMDNISINSTTIARFLEVNNINFTPVYKKTRASTKSFISKEQIELKDVRNENDTFLYSFVNNDKKLTVKITSSEIVEVSCDICTEFCEHCHTLLTIIESKDEENHFYNSSKRTSDDKIESQSKRLKLDEENLENDSNILNSSIDVQEIKIKKKKKVKEDPAESFKNLEKLKVLTSENLMKAFGRESQERTFTDFTEFCAKIMKENSSLIALAHDLTVEQADTTTWHELRIGRITASRFHEATRCTMKNGSFVDKVMGKKSGWSFAMMRGTVLEEYVFEEVKKEFPQLQRSGLIMNQNTNPLFAASPDGLHDDFVLEIKCPSTQHTFEQYIDVNKLSKKYFAQIQLQMFVTEKKKALLAVAHLDFEKTRELTKVWIPLDPDYIEEMIQQATEFYEKAIFPALKKKFLKKL
ncbi:CLUMA_CG001947, isoform A [Clunio marinus]|uniref:CLUMA_CG001947, isoform A n=1 Tax=Clunio marinus TaxID=568069 RepID=A0A1J1HKV1_9DIPT|nr:CLUMA_CG001947, isoform A [Clunio marinus]